MYYNQKSIYYLEDLGGNTFIRIGDKDELILFLAKNTSIDSFDGTLRNKYFENQNITGKDIEKCCNIFSCCEKYSNAPRIYYRRYRFYEYIENNFRTINIFDIYDECIKKYNELMEQRRNRSIWWWYFRKNKNYQGRSYHSGTRTRNKSCKYKRTITLNDDPEYKEFYKSKNSSKEMPTWWDDKMRRVQGNWKEQTKSKKQYGKNIKNTQTIRKMFVEEEDIDVDFLLEKEFNKKMKGTT